MIGILAAYGFTGSLIAKELASRGHSVRLMGRSAQKLKALAVEIGGDSRIVEADVTDQAAIAKSLDGLDVLVNCAGPFIDLGEPVLREAVNQGIHYLDTTGEQPFIRVAIERYGPMAKSKGTTVIPACAFEFALGDAAAAMAAEPFKECDEISLAYYIVGFGSSRGTKKSVLKVMSQSGFSREGAAPKIITNPVSKSFDFPGIGTRRGHIFPGGEVFMSPLHISVKDLRTFMVFPGPAPVVGAMNRLLPKLANSRIGSFASRLIERTQFGPNAEQRDATEFTILCKAQEQGHSRRVVVKGRDPYGLTATIAAEIAVLLHNGQVENTGALSPCMVAGYQKIVDTTSAQGVTWSVTDAGSN